jgi:hypothetical protein
MAISNVTDWDEIEADPDFPSLSQESRAKLFDDWEKKFSRTLLEGADLDKVKPEGLNRLAATNAVRRRKLAGEDVSDLNVAAKTWSEQKQAEAKLAQQALKDYADVEDKKFRLDDARSMPGVDELGRAAPWWEEGVAKATKDLESAEAKLVPEVRAQAQAASEALKGKRKIATLNGNIYTDPALVLDKDEFRQQVLDSDAPPEAKALKLASFQNEKKRYLDEAINTLTKGDPQIPLAESFPKFLESKGFDLDQEMAKQSEGKLDYSPIQKQRELAQEYLTKMQDRGWFRKIGSAISTGVATGMLDIGTQAAGTAAMLTGKAGNRVFPTQHPFVKNPDGGSSNVMMAGVGLEGKEYVIPTMVNGKQLSIEEAVEVARKAGLDKYPSFSTAKEADDFAQKNHGSIDENGYLRDPSGEGLSKSPQNSHAQVATSARHKGSKATCRPLAARSLGVSHVSASVWPPCCSPVALLAASHDWLALVPEQPPPQPWARPRLLREHRPQARSSVRSMTISGSRARRTSRRLACRAMQRCFRALSPQPLPPWAVPQVLSLCCGRAAKN